MTTFILAHSVARQRAREAIVAAPEGYIVTIKQPTRSLESNALMWVLLGALSAQVVWHGQKLSAEEWKTMCTASLKQQRVLPGISGGFVVMGDSTRKMTVAEMGELIEFIHAFGAEHNVDFGEHVVAEPA